MKRDCYHNAMIRASRTAFSEYTSRELMSEEEQPTFRLFFADMVDCQHDIVNYDAFFLNLEASNSS
jgi:hypothetical protein